MKELVGRKIIALEDSILGLTKGKEYKIVKQTNDKFWFITDKGTKEYTYLIHSALFKLVDKPQFKQGDKVLVSKDGVEWFERLFVLEYKGNYYCETDSGKSLLIYWEYIKPYEDEIKVGDWVKSENGNHVYKVISEQSGFKNWIKITNQDLIDKLNKL